MYRYTQGRRSVGVLRGVGRWDDDVFYVQALGSTEQNSVQIEFTRDEALRMKKNLTRLLAQTTRAKTQEAGL